ncbi:serine/threonine-protein kinase DCLK3 [Trichomycterus rosablanca]|uniref:serine/threonine-protein kinase DCLK3 n=1 Tax=Trichomycterus rosablanca TaxID=2290929 RepID=UPI002F355CD4
MWNRNLKQKATRTDWKTADQRTKLPKCPNASPRQALLSYTYGSKYQKHPAAYRPMDKAGIGTYEWEEPDMQKASGYHGRHADTSPVRPRIVTVVRPCGEHSVRKISLLLNRRAVQTFELLVADVSEALGFPCWNSGRVRRLFSPAGREIRSLSDFFYFGHAFLAFGNSRPSLGEVQAALNELYPDNQEYSDSLLRLWEQILRPKPAKTDSGFHDDMTQVDSTAKVVQNPLVTQPLANNLQPSRGQVRQKERGKRERQRGEWENRGEKGQIKPQLKEESTERKKEPVYCRSCRVTGPPVPPIGSRHHDKQEGPINQSDVQLSQESLIKKSSHQHSKTEKTVKQRDWWEELPPDGVQVSLEEIQRCYEISSVVGDGNFAVVRECRIRGCSQIFAMKIVDKAKLQGRVHMIQNEIALLSSLAHPRLVQLLRSHHTDTHVYLLMELVADGDLFDAISRSGRFTEPCTARMIKDISQALEYIHNKSIAHRDIKPENLLVQCCGNDNISIKLADFGLAMVVTEPVFTVCGTPTYVAPEILAETGYGVSVDVWAMGVILFVLLSGFPPFRSPERDQEELFRLIQKGEFHFVSPYWDHVSDGAKALIRALLEVDPVVRLTASQTLQNSWLLHAASQSDHKEATKTSDIVITRKDDLKSRSIKHQSNQANLEISAPEEQNEENKKSITNKYGLRQTGDTEVDKRDQQSLKKPSQQGETCRNGDLDTLAKPADITEKSKHHELPQSEQVKSINNSQQT